MLCIHLHESRRVIAECPANQIQPPAHQDLQIYVHFDDAPPIERWAASHFDVLNTQA